MASYTSDMPISAMLTARAQDLDAPTQPALAALWGTSQPTVNRWHTGRQVPGERWVPKLARHLGIDESEVVAAIHRQRVTRTKPHDPDSPAEDLLAGAIALLHLVETKHLATPTLLDVDFLQEQLDEIRGRVDRLAGALDLAADVSDHDFALAASDGLPTEQGPERHRPAPDLEPGSP